MRDDLMVQQQVENEWQHMVGVICLNQTGRKKVKKVLPGFFKKFPTAGYLLQSDKDTIAEMLKDLGMNNVRANRIWRMSGNTWWVSYVLIRQDARRSRKYYRDFLKSFPTHGSYYYQTQIR